ncbi:MAG: phenylacetate--CoA ligase family protein [Betaproteobacteria bacterium]
MLPPFDLWRSASVAADVLAVPHGPPAALAQRRCERLAALLGAAAQGSPLYREWFAGRDPARLTLEELPVARKPALMARFDDWVCDPAIRRDELRRFVADPARIAEPFLGRYVVWESSGSSGEPAVFVQDAAAMAVYDALEVLRQPLLRPAERMFDPFGLAEQLAFVGATGGHFATTVSIERLRRLNPLLAGRLHGVSFLQPTADLVAELNALSPSVLASYPSAAVLLAEEQRAGRLHIAPHEVWTGGETLTAAMARYVEESFGCPVADSYGASEFLALAFACRQGRLHLNSDWAILEPVDAEGRPVPPGVTSASVLLTNLANHVQPLIRYDLGDRVLVHAEPCACGSTLPAIEVQGRCDDTLRLAAHGASVPVLPLALATVLEDEAGLFDFQLVQEGPAELLLRVAQDGAEAKGALRRGRAALARFLERQGVVAVRIRCRSGEAPRVGRSGKLQRVVGLGC